MPPSTRDLLAFALGERPLTPSTSSDAPAVPSPSASCPSQTVSSPCAIADDNHPRPWRVTAKLTGNRVQITNHRESRVIPSAHLETYLRGHGPAVLSRR
jgi:hypothetical protein